MDKKPLSFSVIFHIVLFVVLFIVAHKKIHQITPSRSNGMVVQLVSIAPTQNQKSVTQQRVTTTQKISTSDFVGEINMRKTPKTQKKQIEKPKEVVKEKKQLVKKDTKEKKIPSKLKKTSVEDKNISDLDLSLDGLVDSDDTQPTKSKGVALGGSSLGTSSGDNSVSNYADLVVRAVRKYWNTPEGTSKNTHATIEVVLNPNLGIKSLSVETSSGDNVFNQSILDAINKMHQFPQLPQNSNFIDYRILHLKFIP